MFTKAKLCLGAHSAQLCREGEALGSNAKSVTYSLTNPGNESLLGLRPSVPALLSGKNQNGQICFCQILMLISLEQLPLLSVVLH